MLSDQTTVGASSKRATHTTKAANDVFNGSYCALLHTPCYTNPAFLFLEPYACCQEGLANEVALFSNMDLRQWYRKLLPTGSFSRSANPCFVYAGEGQYSGVYLIAALSTDNGNNSRLLGYVEIPPVPKLCYTNWY